MARVGFGAGKSSDRDVKLWLSIIQDAISDCDEVPEAGEDFAASVKDKLESIGDRIEETQRVTEGQERAIINMKDGLSRWMR